MDNHSVEELPVFAGDVLKHPLDDHQCVPSWPTVMARNAALVQVPAFLAYFQPKVVAKKLNQEGMPFGGLRGLVDEFGGDAE